MDHTKWFASPACTELESVVLDWSAKMFGLDKAFWNENETGGGVIQVSHAHVTREPVLITVLEIIL